jgi:hypothetical protein
VLVQPVKEMNASAADHKKHRPRWRISALPVFYGIFPGTFLLTAWFSHMLGIPFVAWSTHEVVVWPFVFGYRLFRKAPPWVLWKVPPLAIHLLKQYLETRQDALAFLERCILIEDWFLWIYQSKIVPWCQLNVQFELSCTLHLAYHIMTCALTHSATLRTNTRIRTTPRNLFNATRLDHSRSHSWNASMLNHSQPVAIRNQ